MREKSTGFVNILSESIDHMKVGVIFNKGGNARVICTEGVSWVVPDEGFKFNDYDPTAPAYTIEGLKELYTGEVVDLADFIRVFGARLESNFRHHVAWMEGVEK